MEIKGGGTGRARGGGLIFRTRGLSSSNISEDGAKNDLEFASGGRNTTLVILFDELAPPI